MASTVLARLERDFQLKLLILLKQIIPVSILLILHVLFNFFLLFFKTFFFTLLERCFHQLEKVIVHFEVEDLGKYCDGNLLRFLTPATDGKYDETDSERQETVNKGDVTGR